MSRVDLISNGDFAARRDPPPPPTVTTLLGKDQGGLCVAADWGVWNNAAPATTTTEVVPDAANPIGAKQVLRVRTTDAACGIVNTFRLPGEGPARVRSSAWVKVLRGAVVLGTGNGGNTQADTSSRPDNGWQLLSALNGVSPANELIIYASAPDTEFLVSHVTSQEIRMPDEPRAPLADLQADGTPAIINYSIPEPMSFSGRNYIEILLPPEAFTSVQSAAPPSAQRGLALGESEPATLTARLQGVQTQDVVQLPPSVVPQWEGDDSGPLLAASPLLTDRLAALTRGAVRAIAAAGKRVIIHPAVGGMLDYRVVDAPQSATAVVAGLTAGTSATRSALAAPAQTLTGEGPGEGGGSGGGPVTPTLTVFIDTPQSNSSLHGSAAGVVVHVSGRWASGHTVGDPSITVALDTATAVSASLVGHTFALDVPIGSAGNHTITVTASKTAYNSDGDAIPLTSVARSYVSVELDPANPDPPPSPPTVTITSPADATLLLSQQGFASVTVGGTTSAAAGATVTQVDVQEGGLSYTATPDAAGKWEVPVALTGVGSHTVTATAHDSGHQTGPTASRSVVVSDQQPFRRLLNRLLLVETLNLSSFLGAVGASRVLKTYSLLPGESTTISVKSYTKTTQEQKAASSIVDSNSADCASDFEDSLSAEQSSTETHTEAQNYKIGATVSAGWGWGSASINGEYSGSANAARQEAVKNVSNATRHHSMKASTNRNVTINTEYQVQQEEGIEESTSRTIANINVSRTLNFAFRQMSQRHITLVHLTRVRVAYYTEDLMLDGQGNPAYRKNPDGTDYTDPITGAKVLDIRTTYREVPLPELQSLLSDAVTTDYRAQVQQAILNALSGIPDYQDRLQRAYEWVVPAKEDGTPVPEAKYMQFPAKLQTTFVDPDTDMTITVPGIVLASDHITMRTDGVLVDSILGPGEALDSYSQQLQQVALAERQVAVAERQAEIGRQQLAQKLVSDHDDVGAAVYAKVFPPAPNPIVAG